MDDMVEQNAMLAERTSIASGSMRDKARELEELMQFFKVNRPLMQEEEHDVVMEEHVPKVDIEEETVLETEHVSAEETRRVFVPPHYVEDDDEWEEF
jgi:hypothetical protein